MSDLACQHSNEHAVSVPKLLGEIIDQRRLLWRQAVGIDVAPVAVVEFERLLPVYRTRRIAIPRKQTKLREVVRHDRCCAMLDHALGIFPSS